MRFNLQRKYSFILLIAGVVFLLLGLFFYQRHLSIYKTKQKPLELKKDNWQVLKKKIEEEISRFKGEAGIVIKDLDTGWEIAFNKEKLFPSASLVKIPIMAGCFLAIEEGRLKLNQEVKLRQQDKLSGGILRHVYPGTVLTVERLIGLMIYESDNTATNILTELLGIEYLNNCFKKFGLKYTLLSRRVADYNLREKGVENYTTAEEITYLLEKIYNQSLVSKEISERCLNLMKLQRINDRIPKYLPAEVMVAHKTGLEQGVCHDAGIIFTKKKDFILCILTSHKERNSDLAKEFIARIAFYTYSYLI
ncbi:MAG: class A beta-lactamase-related serine hydrolase [Candidatus Omnitrophica bacterium]|nr:class A beta-lactamase-related serine hydrolase [Candidatus Omnitrophota bacterium]